MNVLLEDLNEARIAFDQILGTNIDVKLAYRIRKIAGKVLSELKSFDEQRIELVKQYGAKDKSGEFITTIGQDGKPQFKIATENEKKFDKEFEELLKIEVDIGGELIPFDVIDKTTSIICPHCKKELEKPQKFSPYNIARLMKFMEEPKEKDKPKDKTK